MKKAMSQGHVSGKSTCSYLKAIIVSILASLWLFESWATQIYPVMSWTVDTNMQLGPVAVDNAYPFTTFVNGTNSSVRLYQFFANSTIGQTPISVSLTNVGDQIILTGRAYFTGGGSGTYRDYGNVQWRIGLFYKGDRNPPPQIQGTNWLGYFIGAPNAGNTAQFYERTDPNAGMYASLTGANSVSGPRSTAYFAPGQYDFALSIIRSGENQLQFTYSVTGTNVNGTYNIVSDVITDDTPTTFTFDRVGMLCGASVSAQEIKYEGIAVTYIPIPEPSAAALCVVGILGIVIVGTAKKLRA